MAILEVLFWGILFLGPLVVFHELGHFLVAKACDVKVLSFSVGFGPKIWGRRIGETEYKISVLPLGGYVKMLGEVPESDIDPADEPRSFAAKPVWQRSLIALAGPVANLVLAFFVYWVMFTGATTFGDTRVGVVTVGEPAWEAGIRPGDRLLAVDDTPLETWRQVAPLVAPNAGVALRFEVEREGKKRELTITPAHREETNVFQETETRGKIGVAPFYVKPIVGVIDPASPAALADIVTGDQVLEVNGKSIEAFHEIRAALLELDVGSEVALKLKRGDETLDRVVAVSEVPSPTHAFERLSSADPRAGYLGLLSKESLIDEVEQDTPAERAGLEPNDRLLELRISDDAEKHRVPVNTYAFDLEAMGAVDARSQIEVVFQRGDEVLTRLLQLETREERDALRNKRQVQVFGATNASNMLGTYTKERDVGLFESMAIAVTQVGADATMIATGLAKLVQGAVPLDTMGGPIMLFVIAERSAKRGAMDFFRVFAMISVNLGMLNLLPIPVLDGGHLVMFAIEAIRRRAPSPRFREVANLVGMALLLALMVVVFSNDILRFVVGT